MRRRLGRLLAMTAVGATLAVAPATHAYATPTNCSTDLYAPNGLSVLCTGGTGTVQIHIDCYNDITLQETMRNGPISPVGVKSGASCPYTAGWGPQEYWYTLSG